VVAVLHDLNLAAAFAPRVVVLHEGRVAADGQPDEILDAGLVRRVFGVEVASAVTDDGRAVLALSLEP
jgi:iron complex transport system ATP-binding protein